MFDTKYNGNVRHAIDFFGQRANVPKALQSYPGFFYSASKGRISFTVAPGTSFKKLTGAIYSTDPAIQNFNRIFSEANKQLNWSKVKTYDFASTETSEVQNTAPVNNTVPGSTVPTKPNSNPGGSSSGGGSGGSGGSGSNNDTVFIVGTAAIVGFLLYKMGSKPKRKRR
ncbi:MAG: hypothetical protein SFU98_16360 [Leptospiraceae bacterium]|nr:hypothetical protein [Leptospiraceae bacterium]